MAYDIQGIVDPKEVVLINSLNKSLNESTDSLIKFIENQERLKKQFDETAKSTATAAEKAEKHKKTLDETAKHQQELEKQQKQLLDIETKLNTVNSQFRQTRKDKLCAILAAYLLVKDFII